MSCLPLRSECATVLFCLTFYHGGGGAGVYLCSRLEGVVDGAFAVGSSLTLADLLIYNKLAETLADKDKPRPDFPADRSEPFGNAEATAAALKEYPKIASILESVKANPGVKQWLETRGKQMF